MWEICDHSLGHFEPLPDWTLTFCFTEAQPALLSPPSTLHSLSDADPTGDFKPEQLISFLISGKMHPKTWPAQERAVHPGCGLPSHLTG